MEDETLRLGDSERRTMKFEVVWNIILRVSFTRQILFILYLFVRIFGYNVQNSCGK